MGFDLPDDSGYTKKVLSRAEMLEGALQQNKEKGITFPFLHEACKRLEYNYMPREHLF